MANEAVLVLKTEEPVDMIVEDTLAVEKGTIMALSGSSTIGRTVSGSTLIDDVFGGIARREKIASDKRTRLACFWGGIFRMTATPSPISAGAAVQISGSNLIAAIATADDDINGVKIGTALEDFGGSDTHEVWVGK